MLLLVIIAVRSEQLSLYSVIIPETKDSCHSVMYTRSEGAISLIILSGFPIKNASYNTAIKADTTMKTLVDMTRLLDITHSTDGGLPDTECKDLIATFAYFEIVIKSIFSISKSIIVGRQCLNCFTFAKTASPLPFTATPVNGTSPQGQRPP